MLTVVAQIGEFSKCHKTNIFRVTILFQSTIIYMSKFYLENHERKLGVLISLSTLLLVLLFTVAIFVNWCPKEGYQHGGRTTNLWNFLKITSPITLSRSRRVPQRQKLL